MEPLVLTKGLKKELGEHGKSRVFTRRRRQRGTGTKQGADVPVPPFPPSVPSPASVVFCHWEQLVYLVQGE